VLWRPRRKLHRVWRWFGNFGLLLIRHSSAIHKVFGAQLVVSINRMLHQLKPVDNVLVANLERVENIDVTDLLDPENTTVAEFMPDGGRFALKDHRHLSLIDVAFSPARKRLDFKVEE
jgi:hypothetical protein